jgi:hypothetical protein
MFGRDKKPTPLVGAKAKREAAIEHMRAGSDAIRSGKGKEKDDTLPVLVATWGFTCALLLLLMQGRWEKGIPFSLSPALDRLLFRMPPPALTGDHDGDLLAAMFIRGTLAFIAFGLVPGIVWIAQTARGNRGKKPSLGMFWAVYALLIACGVIFYKLF